MGDYQASKPDPAVGDLAGLGRDAIVWGLPLLVMGRYLAAAQAEGVTFNRFVINSEIATPRSNAVGLTSIR